MADINTPTDTVQDKPLHVHLLCMHEKFSDAFLEALKTLPPPTYSAAAESAGNNGDKEKNIPSLNPTTTYTIHNTYLNGLPSTTEFDLVVSPANSYGLMDGGFDDALSKAFSPRRDYYALTRLVQASLSKNWRGYLPVGSTEIVELPDEWTGLAAPSRPKSDGDQGDENKESQMPGSWNETAEKINKNVWGCRYIAVCPTMRVPCDANWDREVVYECTWSLLCAIQRFNTTSVEKGKKIKSILMTPFGTGVGRITPKRWADQTVLAFRHFFEAGEGQQLQKQRQRDEKERKRKESVWGTANSDEMSAVDRPIGGQQKSVQLSWLDVQKIDEEIERTWKDG